MKIGTKRFVSPVRFLLILVLSILMMAGSLACGKETSEKTDTIDDQSPAMEPVSGLPPTDEGTDNSFLCGTNRDDYITIRMNSGTCTIDFGKNDDCDKHIIDTHGGHHGQIKVNSPQDGYLEYTPDKDYYGPDSFQYCTGSCYCPPIMGYPGMCAWVYITITANNAPVAANDSATTEEGTPISIKVLENDSDPDGDTMSISEVTQGAHGTVNISGTSVIYEPNVYYNGEDSFMYTISDDYGGSATATVRVTISPTNDAPIAIDDSAHTVKGISVFIYVLNNDSDPDGDTISITGVTQGAHSQVKIQRNYIIYKPNADYSGEDSFMYTITDGHGGSATATAHVTIDTNDPPVAVDDTASTKEDIPISIKVLENDSDPDGDTLSISKVTQGAHGTVNISDTSVVYTPNTNYIGSDSFTYNITDDLGGFATATVRVTTNHNNAPIAVDDTVITQEPLITINVLNNDSDPDGDTISITEVKECINGGTVRVENNIIVYGGRYNSEDSFMYTITDGYGGSATATVHIIVESGDTPLSTGTPSPDVVH